MEINGAMNAGLQGLQRASQQVSEASAEIANASGRNDVQQQGAAQNSGAVAATETASETSQAVTANTSTDSLVSLQQGETSFESSAQTVETADEMLGTMIDTSV
ncbi:flagellar basal body rod C-terminal domain-containing protein [Idiomarina seosinensis]|uniref:Chemotaxis protein n=1 Tax=Idiomarina seosinensis TaxID=281739 RepID=A0A432ZDH9_9GAMM|nr:hypothetical protein [Idiomarina seosinensis]RUO76006.1 hypothetical protein CWI81_07750 [Idiomarina seosinensis]